MILLGLGSNLASQAGPPADTLRAALDALAARRVRPMAVSRFHETPAWPDPSDPPFRNAVAAVETDLDPDALLAVLHAVEAAFGRVRSVRNAPRTLDLDLLDYGGRVTEGWPRGQGRGLVLPHPKMHERPFVMDPLREVAPDWVHPVLGSAASDGPASS